MERNKEDSSMTEQPKEVRIDAVNEQDSGPKNQKRTVERCFKEKDSNPPVCGVHKVSLVEGETPIDPLAPHLGRINCLICPVSGFVVLDSDENGPD
jgi:hypothetical protein